MKRIWLEMSSALMMPAVAAVVVFIATSGARVEAQDVRGYAGRRVADVLREMPRDGLQLIFNDELVPPTLTVKSEPKAGSPRRIATLLGDALRVRVREGAVVVEHESARWMSRGGEALLIAPGPRMERHTTATSGPDWNWVSELAEPFQLEGATLTAFLQWASREHGWQWQFDNAATERRAGSIVLRGSIDRLTPDEAIDAVLPTCGLVARRSRERLIVSAAPER